MLYPIQKVADVISQVAMPAFATVQDDKPRLAANFERGVQAISLVCFPLSIGIMVCAPLLIPVVFGPRWVPAVATVQILCLNGPRMAVNRLNGAVFQGIGKPQWDLWLATGSLVVYLAAFAIGVQHGITGMAIAYTVAGFGIAPVSQLMATRAVGTTIRRNLWAVRHIAVATAVMAAAAEAVRRGLAGHVGQAPALAGVVVAGAIAYGAVILVTARPLAERTIRDLVRRGS
jgi:O-antigen/teichoic acid export membrane protein